jgi:hypothetical protein
MRAKTIRSSDITNPTTGETGLGMMSADAPFGRAGTTIAHGDHVYHGSGGPYEIQVLTRESTLARLIRRPIPDSAVTEEDKDFFRADRLENAGD